MDARYVQRGDSIDHTPMGDIPAGEVLGLGKLICVAKLDMKADELGAFALTGVYELPKAPGVALAQGEEVGWNAATKKAYPADAPATMKFGHAVATAAVTDATVLVRLCQGLNR